MSTTLTREGVQMIKDMVSSNPPSKESLVPVENTHAASSTVSTGVFTHGTADVSEEDNNDQSDEKNSSGGSWLSSWFFSRADRTGKGSEEESS